MIARAVRIDARRPASWIALGAAVAVAAGFPAGGAIVPALACGGLLVVAAVGDLLPGTPRDQFAGARIAGARILARSIWPLVGLLGGGAAVGAPFAVVAALVGGLLATAACLVTAILVGSTRRWAHARPTVGLPGDGRGEPWADRVAMGSMLVAMAICYFLAPELGGWYAVLASAWLVLLAVPRATLWGHDASARHRLIHSAVGRPRPPGTAVHAARSLAASGCLLGWPAVVALALGGGRGGSESGPAAALGLLVASAAVAAGAAAVAERRRLPADTPLAVTAALLAGFVARTAQVP